MADVGNFGKQQMHTQLIGKANFGELTSREDVLRYRKINYFLTVGLIILLGYTILRVRFGMNELAIWSGVVGGIFLLVLLFRLGFIRKRGARRGIKTRQASHRRSVNKIRKNSGRSNGKRRGNRHRRK